MNTVTLLARGPPINALSLRMGISVGWSDRYGSPRQDRLEHRDPLGQGRNEGRSERAR